MPEFFLAIDIPIQREKDYYFLHHLQCPIPKSYGQIGAEFSSPEDQLEPVSLILEL